MNIPTSTVRINISLPANIAYELKKTLPARSISKFFVEAAKEKLETLEQDKAFDKLLNGPPAFPQIKNSVRWVRELRNRDIKRLKQLGI